MPSIKTLARSLLRGPNGRLKDGEFQTPDWDSYRMDIHRPFEVLEPPARETRIVDHALAALASRGILAGTTYDTARYDAMRDAVRTGFEIPWTAITPRMQRLIYAINAIRRPQVMIAAGVFCGDTFISNAGAAVGPGAVYTARALVGLEISPAEAARAEANVRRVDPTGTARVLAEDAVGFCRDWQGTIDLLYLDADGDGGRGKAIYSEILAAAWDKLPEGALILAHNSVNSVREMRDYLAFVRDARNCRASVNVVLDPEGLEVTVR